MNRESYIRGLRPYAAGEWYMFPRAFLTFLSGDESIMLAYVTNQAFLMASYGKDSNGWVPMTTSHIQEELPFNKIKVERLLKVLRSQRVIIQRVRGIPRERSVKVKVKRLETLVLNARNAFKPVMLSKASKVMPSEGSKVMLSSSLEEKMKEHCPACRRTDWVGLAHLLGVTLAKFRKVTINDSKTKGWAKEISKAHTIDGMDPERITDDLKWYCDTLAKEGDLIRSNPGFFPIANAGDSFRKKILPIEDARARRMNRHKSHNSTKPIKNHGKILKGRASLDEW